LFEVNIRYTALFLEFSQGSLIEILVFVNETARNGTLPQKGWDCSLDEQYFENSFLDRENHDINCDLLDNFHWTTKRARCSAARTAAIAPELNCK